MNDLVSIAFGDWTARLAPAIGGAICSLRWRDQPILRETKAEAIQAGNVRATACYPLVPYANRIAQRRFGFGGTDYALADNFPGSPHSLHGVGWRRIWRVEAVDERSCVMTLEHRPIGDAALDWPFAFDARQTFSLGAGGLTVILSVANAGDVDVPAGIGLHSFFPRRPGQRLAFRSAGAWLNGPDMLPNEKVSGGDWDFSAGRVLDAAALDNDFFGWDGVAEMAAADGPKVSLHANSAFGSLRVFTPTGADFFAAEPVSHRADAIHHPDEADAMTVLAPGETLKGEARFSAEAGA